MKLFFVLFLILSIPNLCFSQLKTNGSDWLNKTLADSIHNETSIQVEKMAGTVKKDMTERELEFLKDTFEIEFYLDAAKKAVHYSDISTMRLIYEALEKYEIVLDKYYKQLLANAISPQSLTESQKAWAAFKDKEIAYFSRETVGEESLANWGTLDRVEIAGFSLRLTKRRTIELFRGIK